MDRDPITVVKLGGALLEDAGLRKRYASALAELQGPLVLVHGGGREATRLAARLGIHTRMVEGRRITDRQMLDVVTMVCGGRTNRTLVAELQAAGRNSIGLTGADADIVRAVRRPVTDIDYGYVGDITHVNADRLLALIDIGLMPVVAPLTHDAEGGLLNTNADTMASAIAAACAPIREVSLLMCFDRKGVLDVAGETLGSIDPESAESLVAARVISDGMYPKLQNAFDALRGGVNRAVLCHADDLAAAGRGDSGPWTEVKLT